MIAKTEIHREGVELEPRAGLDRTKAYVQHIEIGVRQGSKHVGVDVIIDRQTNGEPFIRTRIMNDKGVEIRP
jgi:hypothetical protein